MKMISNSYVLFFFFRDLNAGYNGQIFSPEEYFDDEGRAINSSESELTQRTTQQAGKLLDTETNFFISININFCFQVFEALKKKITPIIIDNTNAISAQMKPYVVMVKLNADFTINLSNVNPLNSLGPKSKL